MRVKMPSWRMQEERESEEPARMRPSAAQGRFGSSALFFVRCMGHGVSVHSTYRSVPSF